MQDTTPGSMKVDNRHLNPIMPVVRYEFEFELVVEIHLCVTTDVILLLGCTRLPRYPILLMPKSVKELIFFPLCWSSPSSETCKDLFVMKDNYS